MADLTLGGGYGPLSGSCGLAADNLLGAEIVLADGRRVITVPTRSPGCSGRCAAVAAISAS
jgi:FAD/FMN-containing dehydrogenase